MRIRNYKILELPALYQETETAFWDDDHISKQMLKAHLDPDFDGASRRLAFINRSAAWISRMIPPQSYPALLDVGCGPGLYAERFAKSGYAVTGVDFSSRSIRYAQHTAKKYGLKITYLCQNYLSLELDARFDFATMIYCDYGALSTEKRRTVLQNLYQHLRPGGKLLLDVFSATRYDAFEERQTWTLHKKGGFWREDAYVELSRFCKYPDCVTLDQFIIVSGGKPTAYYLWNTHFTQASLEKEANEAGFSVCGFYGDVAGSPFHEQSPTIAAILVK